MKGKLVLVFTVLLLFGFSSFSCFAQSANNDQRIVGTWVRDGDYTITLVFNANGSGNITIPHLNVNQRSFTFGISIIGTIGSTDSTIHDLTLYFSPDGRTMYVRSNIMTGVYRKR